MTDQPLKKEDICWDCDVVPERSIDIHAVASAARWTEEKLVELEALTTNESSRAGVSLARKIFKEGFKAALQDKED